MGYGNFYGEEIAQSIQADLEEYGESYETAFDEINDRVDAARARRGPRRPVSSSASSGASWVRLRRGRNLVAEGKQRMELLVRQEKLARSKGAARANQAISAELQTGVRRPRNSLPRPGRVSAPLRGNVQWVASADPRKTAVGLSAEGAKRVPHWKIAEIGSGKSGTMRRAADPKGVVRGGKPAKEGIRVPSQIGRPVGRRGVPNVTLGFGPAPRVGKYFAPSSARAGMDSVHRLSDLSLGGEPIRKIVIRRDIVGKHMVRDSGKAGFQEYQKLVLLAGRSAFEGAKHKARASAK